MDLLGPQCVPEPGVLDCSNGQGPGPEDLIQLAQYDPHLKYTLESSRQVDFSGHHIEERAELVLSKHVQNAQVL